MKKITSLSDYNDQYSYAAEANVKYWEEVAAGFEWQKKWDFVLSGDFTKANIKWFDGAVTNITTNAIDRHLKHRANKVALMFAANDPKELVQKITYQELSKQVNRLANGLKSLGVKKGDRVCLYMGMVPELMYTLLACARIGAVHSVVFGGFSAKALASRINDCGAKLLITNDGSFRGNKVIDLKSIVDEALVECPKIEKVVIAKRINTDFSPSNKLDRSYEELSYTDLIKEQSSDCLAEPMQAEDALFILYTSGSTGKPKGLVHTTAGYMVYVAHSFKNVFQMEEQDIFWCTADIGWITGHSYLTYGPLLNGATTVMFEGVPTWPDAGRFWQVIDQLKVTHFYTAPTAIRSLQLQGLEFVKKHKLNSLKVLGSVGEPINEEAWHWYFEHIGKKKCPIVDTWWQTETGGIMISPIAKVTELIPAMATKPLPGVFPVLMDEKGSEITESKAEGRLCIKRPWPSMARSIYGDHQRFIDTYFSTFKGYYFTGDGAKRDDQGNYRITGRVDDIIIVSGHNIGTAEVESAIDEHSDVVECAVVGYDHDIKGQAIYAFVIVNKSITNEEQLISELNNLVNKHLGPIAKPEKIQIVPDLPKTRSGKIMRRILRKIAQGSRDFGDTSTLLDPNIVEVIQSGVK